MNIKCPYCGSEHLFVAKTQHLLNPRWYYYGEKPKFSNKYKCYKCGSGFNIKYD